MNFAKTLKPNTTINATVHTFDHSNNEDVHELTCQVNYTSGPAEISASKTGPNTFSITSGPSETSAFVEFFDEGSAPIARLYVTCEDRDIVNVDITY